MSDEYRDDTQETAYISDSSWISLTTITDEVLRATTILFVALLVMHTDYTYATDEVIDHQIVIVDEQSYISTEVYGVNQTHQLIEDGLKVSDVALAGKYSQLLAFDELALSEAYMTSLRAITKESSKVSDLYVLSNATQYRVNESVKVIDHALGQAFKIIEVDENLLVSDAVFLEQFNSVITDQVHVDEHWQIRRTTSSNIDERAKITDRSTLVFPTFIMDTAQIGETYLSKLLAHGVTEDLLNFAEEFPLALKYKEVTEDHLIASETLATSLSAQSLTTEFLFLEDDFLHDQIQGFAWTANADTWAMSRYTEYPFDDLTVINGVVYGVNNQGVHRLDAMSQQINGQIITGKLDLSQGPLVHPLAAYIEYELSGNAKKLEVGVSTSQSGSQQTYFYLLPTENADDLTNGRVLFGRGLRGRHFAFEIKIFGEHGYINDLNIDVVATKRRV